MLNTIRIAIAVSLIVGTGLIHGFWTHRWGSSRMLVALAERFESVPMTVGQWKGTTSELPARHKAMAGATACLSRVYRNTNSGVSISVLLLGGLPGKISTHTPDICYTGAGYTLGTPITLQRRYGEGDAQAEFRTALATRGGTNPSVLRIIWAWNASKGWSAPAEPRWIFASEPVLSKLYLVRETGGTVADVEDDPCAGFLDALLPELDRFVFSLPQ